MAQHPRVPDNGSIHGMSLLVGELKGAIEAVTRTVDHRSNNWKMKDDAMTQIMNASDVKVMTDGQIEDAVNKLRDAMRKHRSENS